LAALNLERRSATGLLVAEIIELAQGGVRDATPMRKHNRRDVLTLIGSAVVIGPCSASAQSSPPLIAVLEGASAASMAKRHAVFRDGLRQLGYVEGRNCRFEWRFADGFLDRLPALAEELVRLSPSVIVSSPMPANLAVHKATTTIPIVMANGADPVAFGLVQSLSRPGGNMTGLTNFAESLASKQLDVIREMLPGIRRVGTLVNVENPLHVPQWRDTEDAAAQVAVSLVRFDYRTPEDLEQAFDQFARAKAEAVLIAPDVTFVTHAERIARLAIHARLPTVSFSRIAVEAGGLLSYGPDLIENYRRAAVFVDKILKGANPSELPIERPTKIELVINLGVARALGLTIPPTLLARADGVIE
jgi:putative ABC transport system substrate-binding protein